MLVTDIEDINGILDMMTVTRAIKDVHLLKSDQSIPTMRKRATPVNSLGSILGLLDTVEPKDVTECVAGADSPH